MTSLRSPPGTSRPDRVVSPELALVDPALAAEERARLPERHATPSAFVRVGAPPDERRAFQALATAALEAHEPGAPGRTSAPAAWPRLAAVAVVTVLVLLLLDVRVDVGRTPASAESTDEIVPPAAEPSRPPPAIATQPRSPAPVTTRPASRKFAWAPVAGADAYRVELFKGDVRVFVATSKSAQLTVPARWTLGGERRALTPGEYRWYVWTISSGRRAQNAVVQATLTVP